MKTSRLAAVAALLLLAACGKGPSEPDPLDSTVAGAWRVAGHGSVVVEVGIRAPGSGSLTGCIAVGYDTVSRPLDRTRVGLAGIRTGKAVELGAAPGHAPLWMFVGTRQALDTLVGTGRLDGGAPAPVRMVRVGEQAGC